MINQNKFRAVCAERGITLRQLAIKLGIEPSYFYVKLKNSHFRLREVKRVKEELELSNDELVAIFFTD